MIITIVVVSIVFIAIVAFLIFKLLRSINEIYDLYYRIDNLEKDNKKTKNEAEETKIALQAEEQKKQQLENKLNNIKCLICASPSNGKHYCYSCYTKFKNQSFDVRIKNCNEAEIIDYYGNKSFLCDDGRMVRSRAEALISNFLFNNKIRYIYEKPIYYKEANSNKILHPDFYLPDYDLYIEYNELLTDKYLQSKEYAMRIYRSKGMRIFVMTNQDLFNISQFILPKLEK